MSRRVCVCVCHPLWIVCVHPKATAATDDEWASYECRHSHFATLRVAGLKSRAQPSSKQCGAAHQRSLAREHTNSSMNLLQTARARRVKRKYWMPHKSHCALRPTKHKQPTKRDGAPSRAPYIYHKSFVHPIQTMSAISPRRHPAKSKPTLPYTRAAITTNNTCHICAARGSPHRALNIDQMCETYTILCTTYINTCYYIW